MATHKAVTYYIILLYWSIFWHGHYSILTNTRGWITPLYFIRRAFDKATSLTRWTFKHMSKITQHSACWRVVPVTGKQYCSIYRSLETITLYWVAHYWHSSPRVSSTHSNAWSFKFVAAVTFNWANNSRCLNSSGHTSNGTVPRCSQSGALFGCIYITINRLVQYIEWHSLCVLWHELVVPDWYFLGCTTITWTAI